MRKDSLRYWRLLTTGFSNAFENMAVDEAVLEACRQGQSPPTIRFYGWEPHAVSLGYSQRVEDTVNIQVCERFGIDVVRRATGGRAVLHDKELTYSLISPLDNPLFPMNILGTYKRISSCLIAGFKRLGIIAQLVTSSSGRKGLFEKRSKSSCFLSPSWYEIVVGCRKICGSAQRRVDGAFLQHGSILLGFDAGKLSETLVFEGLERGYVMNHLETNITSVNDQLCEEMEFLELQEIFIGGFEEGLGIDLKNGGLSLQEERLREHYLRNCYLDPGWNLRN